MAGPRIAAGAACPPVPVPALLLGPVAAARGLATTVFGEEAAPPCCHPCCRVQSLCSQRCLSRSRCCRVAWCGSDCPRLFGHCCRRCWICCCQTLQRECG